MRHQRELSTSIAAAVLLSFAAISPVIADGNSDDPPVYEVNRLATEIPAPVINGVIDEGEWDTAAAAAGDFVELFTFRSDRHDLRFRMLWDDEHLYVLGETDYTGFGAPVSDFDDPSFAGQSYTPGLFFDPNRDGEDLSMGRTEDSVDGYQISWSVQEGFSSRRPTAGDPDRSLRSPTSGGQTQNDYVAGLLLESYVNSPGGNQGGWSQDDTGPNQNYRDDTHPGLVFAQNASNTDLNGTGEGGAVWEWAIDWSEFNATDPMRLLSEDDGNLILKEIPNPFDPLVNMPNSNYLGEPGEPDPRYADPTSELYLENGLYAPTAPEIGDTWAFETGASTPDTRNVLPSWSQPMSGDQRRVTLASWGRSSHGQLVFMDAPAVGLDCDGDGQLTGADLDCVTIETLDETIAGLMILPGDIDADGKVAFSDFLVMSTNFAQDDKGYTGGDIDLDGRVAFGDFLVLSTNFGMAAPTDNEPPTVTDPPANPLDCDGNGEFNGADLACVTTGTLDDMIEGLMILPGDIDADGKVAFSDFLVMSTNFAQDDKGYTGGDIDLDGRVAFGDFLVLSTNFGMAASAVAGEAASVPEPSSLLLLCFGMLAVRRRPSR